MDVIPRVILNFCNQPLHIFHNLPLLLEQVWIGQQSGPNSPPRCQSLLLCHRVSIISRHSKQSGNLGTPPSSSLSLGRFRLLAYSFVNYPHSLGPLAVASTDSKVPIPAIVLHVQLSAARLHSLRGRRKLSIISHHSFPLFWLQFNVYRYFWGIYRTV
jgi:hypothetical protein